MFHNHIARLAILLFYKLIIIPEKLQNPSLQLLREAYRFQRFLYLVNAWQHDSFDASSIMKPYLKLVYLHHLLVLLNKITTIFARVPEPIHLKMSMEN